MVRSDLNSPVSANIHSLDGVEYASHQILSVNPHLVTQEPTIFLLQVIVYEMYNRLGSAAAERRPLQPVVSVRFPDFSEKTPTAKCKATHRQPVQLDRLPGRLDRAHHASRCYGKDIEAPTQLRSAKTGPNQSVDYWLL